MYTKEEIVDLKLFKHQQIIYDTIMNYDFKKGTPLKICLNWGRCIGTTTLIQKILASEKFGSVSLVDNIEPFIKKFLTDEMGGTPKRIGDITIDDNENLKNKPSVVISKSSYTKLDIDISPNLLIAITRIPTYETNRINSLYNNFDIVDIKNYRMVKSNVFSEDKIDQLTKESDNFKEELLIVCEKKKENVSLNKEYELLVKEFKETNSEPQLNKLHNKLKVLGSLIDIENKLSSK
jgi:hypothetical protein